MVVGLAPEMIQGLPPYLVLAGVARFFLHSTKYQNGGMYTKLPQNITNVHKVYQIAVK
jgi:hypothetical protein